MRTLYAASAQASARYYARYVESAAGEQPGRWVGGLAVEIGVSGEVEVDQLEGLLSGHPPVSGEQLGSKLVDRHTKHGTVIKAVAGYDATFSAPKSVSAWWGLTGDPGVKAAHDSAAQVVLDHIEAHATTRVRVNGPRMYPDVEHGLTMAVFPQSTSREDDPQLHTHAVISGKVIGPNGRWYALDGHYVKHHQRALGGLYQSVLRTELTHRYGIRWGPIVEGQAELADMPAEIMDGADLALLGEDLPVVGVMVAAIGLLLVGIAAVLFVVPALIFLLELLLILALLGLGLVGRLLFRRPWTIEAIEVGSDHAFEWKVTGWRASGELLQSVANQLQATGLPTGGTEVRA